MTLKKPLGVMANGRWYDRGELETLLEGVAAKYEAVAQNPSSRRARIWRIREMEIKKK